MFYFSALMRVDRAINSGATFELRFTGNDAVSQPRFILTPDEMQVQVWANGGENLSNITVSGPNYSVGDTLAFYMALEKGSAADNNVVSIWFNPDFSNLGAADFVSTTDTRFGRDGGTISSIVYFGDNVVNTQYTIDEVRIATVAIPEPGTLMLVGIALGSLLLFRHRK